MLANFALFALALGVIEFSVTAAGADGWSPLDFILPFLGATYACKRIMEQRLQFLISSSSILPLLFLLLAVLHLLTDPRLLKIISAASSYTLPVGGFRIYYTILINVILYYLCPIIITNKAELHKFISIIILLIVAQIIFALARVLLGIEQLAVDSYTTSIHPISDEGESGIRLITLGNMGYLLFTCTITILKEKTLLRRGLLILSWISLAIAGGRAMLFGTVFVGCLYLWIERMKIFPSICVLSIVLIAVCVFSFIPSSVKIPAPFNKYLTVLSPDNPSFQLRGYTRSSMWRAELYMISQHPFWGTIDVPADIDEGARESIFRGDTHNVYLGIASRFGIVTLILWISFVVRQMNYNRRILDNLGTMGELYPFSRLIFYTLLGYLFMFFSIGGAEGGHRPVFLLFGLVDAISVMASGHERGMGGGFKVYG